MTEIIVVVREPGGLKPDYSLKFEVPEVPKVGAYISVQRPYDPEPYGEDLIVRCVWWRLTHPEGRAFHKSEDMKRGSTVEIFVECDPAIGPYSSDKWRDSLRDTSAPVFEVSRYSVRQDFMTSRSEE